jgi:tRNA U54 and U55 pseudouridine synthase Pus10
MNEMPETHSCRICLKSFYDKADLVEHLRADHEPLEVESYAATTMMMEETGTRMREISSGNSSVSGGSSEEMI